MTTPTPADLADLDDIGFCWGKAYEISFDGTSYRAKRRGYQHEVLALTAGELRGLVRADYISWCASLRESSSL